MRRRIAPIIRAGQELGKWLDGVRGPAVWDGGESHLRKPVDSPIGESLALPAAFGHLSEDAVLTSEQGERLRLEADRILRGEWSVLGRAVSLDGDLVWSAHPVTGSSTPRRHWSGIRYLSGDAGGDPKYIWELNRHTCLLRLAQAYHVSREDRYVDGMLRHLRSWMDQERPGVGINWCSSLEVAIRSINWCWMWMLTRTSSAWTEPLLEEFLWQLSRHARHVQRFDSIHHSPNTHLLGEALGLVYVGKVFPVLKGSARWLRRGRNILASEFDHQILPDGFHFERSTGYHRYALETFLHAYLLNRFSLEERPRRQRLEALQGIAVAATGLRRPDGRWPVVGDEDGGRFVHLTTSPAEDVEPLLEVVRRLGSTGRGTASACGATEESSWLLGEGTEVRENQGTEVRENPGERDRAIQIRSAELPEAGFAVGRSGHRDREWYCMVSTGSAPVPEASGHAHADLGHVEVACGEVPIVADPGCPTYTADSGVRNRYRSERAHACLHVEGSPQAVPGEAFSWRELPPSSEVRTRRAGEAWLCELSYRAGEEERLEHRRSVRLTSEGVAVTDVVEGVVPEDRLTLSWPIPHATEEVQFTSERLQVSGILMTWAADETGGSVTPTLERTRRSPTYGEELPGSVLRLRLVGRGIVSCRTLFRVEPTEPVS